jgi:hypothetical protein
MSTITTQQVHGDIRLLRADRPEDRTVLAYLFGSGGNLYHLWPEQPPQPHWPEEVLVDCQCHGWQPPFRTEYKIVSGDVIEWWAEWTDIGPDSRGTEHWTTGYSRREDIMGVLRDLPRGESVNSRYLKRTVSHLLFVESPV